MALHLIYLTTSINRNLETIINQTIDMLTHSNWVYSFSTEFDCFSMYDPYMDDYLPKSRIHKHINQILISSFFSMQLAQLNRYYSIDSLIRLRYQLNKQYMFFLILSRTYLGLIRLDITEVNKLLMKNGDKICF